MINRCTALVAATWSLITFLTPNLYAGTFSANNDVVVDTLAMYSQKTGFVSYDHPSIIRQAARFQTVAPSYLQGVTLLLSGGTGTAVLRICGYEGGLSAPILLQDLQAPLVLKKEREGMQKISVPIHNLLLQNNQFFIVVEQLSPGVKLLSDREKKSPTCAIPNGEKYVYQYLQKADSSWEYGAYGFAIEAAVAFPKIKETVLYCDTTTVENNSSASISGGRSIATSDIDGDGYIDVLAGGKLYMNDGKGHLRGRSDNWGLQGAPQANCFADMDNDGRVDILFLGIKSTVASDSAEPVVTNTLYLNQGKGKFKKLPLQLPPLSSITSFSIADITGDGYADLFVGQCVQPKKKSSILTRNYLLVNNRNLAFEDQTNILLSSDNNGDRAAVCRGSSFVDVNNDNLTDLYIANYYGHEDELWINTGTAFQRKHLNAGIDTTAILSVDGIPLSPEWYSSGCHWMDANNDGSLDLLSARYLNPLYVKQQSSAPISSVHTAYEVLGQQEEASIQQQPTSFDYDERHSAGVWGDVNNDGRIDCLLLTSCQCNYADFYQQQENLSFAVQSYPYGLEGIAGVNDALWIDINNDGSLDLVFLRNDSLIVFRNRAIESGHYVQIDLQSRNSDRNVAGAKVQVYTGAGIYTQQITSGRGLLMQDPSRLHFGLAESRQIDSVKVVWPSSPNYWETFTSVDIDHINTLKEGSGIQKSNYDKSLTKIVGVRSYPNPFRESVNIEFQLLEPAHIVLEVYDIQGNKVGSLLDGNLQAGMYKTVWNGQNSSGLKLPTGTYMYHCTVGDAKIIGKLMLVE